MISSETLVTPDLAKEWLKKNIVNNRPVSQMVVDRYADDMKAGKWQLTSDGISFNESGALVNGQHRLNAIIKANVPVKMYVTYGVPNETYIYDRGHMRGVGNILYMTGMNVSHMDVGFCNFVVSMAKGANIAKSAPDTMVKLILEREGSSIKQAEYLVSRSSSSSKTRFTLTKNSACQVAAWCSIKNGITDSETISNFFKIVNNGMYNNPGEVCAVHFRNYILENAGMSSRGIVEKTKLFKLCMKAIYDFTLNSQRKIAYRESDYEKYEGFKSTLAENIIKSIIAEDRNTKN